MHHLSLSSFFSFTLLRLSKFKRMNRRLSPSLLKFLFRHPLPQLQSPKSSLLSPSLASISSQSKSIFQTQTSLPFSPLRNFCNGAATEKLDVNKAVDEINLKFAEAREEIESAMDSKETVYFNEEAECARDAVKEVLDLFHGLLSKVEDKERASLQRSMGLKMEQLKAEIQQLND